MLCVICFYDSKLNIIFVLFGQGIPETIMPYCTTGEDLDMASHYRVVVSTCISAGTLYMCGIKAGHFTHVFVDEVFNKLGFL